MRLYNHHLLIVSSLTWGVNLVTSSSSQLRGDRILDDDKNYTNCRPGGEGYVNPYEDIKPEPIDDSTGAVAAATTNCVNGKAGSWDCDNVDMLSFISLASMSSQMSNDIWGWTDPQTGKEYAIVGLKEGTAFVDISDPTNPIYLGRMNAHNNRSSSWRDIKVYSNHAYVVSEANTGLQAFDLTQLRNVNNPPVSFSATAHLSTFSNAHNIAINEDTGLAVVVGSNRCSGGLNMIDLSSPANPSFIGCFSSDGYTHDVQCVTYNGPSTSYVGRELCFASNEDTITIVDVTNRNNPNMLARQAYTNSRYTHQGWLTEDHTTFLANDELHGTLGLTLIFDVSDVTNIVLKAQHIGSRPSYMHNEFVKGNFVYQSNYQTGLVIYDVSDASNGVLEEVGFFDVSPESGGGWRGSWSNYPYFDSGVVVATSINLGLFVVRPNLPQAPTSPVPAPSAPVPAPTAPVPAPTSSAEYVKISAFSAKQKERNNGKVKTILRFAVRNDDNVQATTAEISTLITYTASNGSETTEEKTCMTNGKGKCKIPLKTYLPTQFSDVTVSVLDIDSDLGFYNSDENVVKSGTECPVFSQDCPTYDLRADA